MLSTPGFVRPEQWQAQIQALIQRRAEVLLYSSLPDEIVRSAFLTPCHDIGEAVAKIAKTWSECARCRSPARPAYDSVSHLVFYATKSRVGQSRVGRSLHPRAGPIAGAIKFAAKIRAATRHAFGQAGFIRVKTVAWPRRIFLWALFVGMGDTNLRTIPKRFPPCQRGRIYSAEKLQRATWF